MKNSARRFVAALLAAALTAACGGTGGDDSGGEMTLRIAQSSTSVGYFTLYVAQQEGFFEDEGLDIGEPSVLGGDSKVAAALAGGAADIGGGVATTAFLLADGGRDPRIVANLLNSYYVDVIVGNQFSQPPPDATLEEKIQALAGARIGVPAPSGGGAALLQFLFNQVGLDMETDVTMVNLGGSSSGAVGALQTDRVNALVFFQPIGQQVEAQQLGSIYISPSRGDIPDMTDQPHAVAISTAEIVEDKPEEMAAFVRAIARAQELIHVDRARTAELFGTYQSSLDPNTVELLLPVLQREVPDTPVLTEEGYAKTLDFHRVAGLAENAPDFATMSGDDLAGRALDE
ncbi:MAG: ABC transporter substrate-binding protein [Micromonosporaceae bacterium]|nr:ABC transporter substrate-binding protein [Micromonosporaceae bacterium]